MDFVDDAVQGPDDFSEVPPTTPKSLPMGVSAWDEFSPMETFGLYSFCLNKNLIFWRSICHFCADHWALWGVPNLHRFGAFGNEIQLELNLHSFPWIWP